MQLLRNPCKKDGIVLTAASRKFGGWDVCDSVWRDEPMRVERQTLRQVVFLCMITGFIAMDVQARRLKGSYQQGSTHHICASLVHHDNSTRDPGSKQSAQMHGRPRS